MLEWMWPWVFVVAPVPVLIFYFSREGSLQPAALRAPFAARWQSLSGARQPSQSGRWYWWLLWATWMLLIAAIARPQWIGEPIELPNTGRDLMLGLDLSGSMQIEDMQIGNRLVPRITAVKSIAADLTQRRQGDRVGTRDQTVARSPCNITYFHTADRWPRHCQYGRPHGSGCASRSAGRENLYHWY